MEPNKNVPKVKSSNTRVKQGKIITEVKTSGEVVRYINSSNGEGNILEREKDRRNQELGMCMKKRKERPNGRLF